MSVDPKKKALVGPYKNAGRDLRPRHDPEFVEVYDFPEQDQPKAVPYGVFDLAENQAWVSVGISHDTAACAVETIRTWWHEMGQPLSPQACSLLIIAAGGGSNGYRLRLWKVELQKLADELALPLADGSERAGGRPTADGTCPTAGLWVIRHPYTSFLPI